MGKMLRIDVNVADRKNQRYTIPESNPFAKAADPQLMVLFGKSELDFSKIKQKAKPEIWAEQAKFKEHSDKLVADTAKLLATAKTGNLEALKAAVGSVGGTCKACHDSFRSQ